MSEKLCAAIDTGDYNFVCANFANPDMVRRPPRPHPARHLPARSPEPSSLGSRQFSQSWRRPSPRQRLPPQVGHTGDLQAAIKAVESVDVALGHLLAVRCPHCGPAFAAGARCPAVVAWARESA